MTEELEIIRNHPKVLASCYWEEEDDDGNLWISECGIDWVLPAGTPMHNGMRFCPSCGKPLLERTLEETEDQFITKLKEQLQL